MKPSISFDQAAAFYDRTRGFPREAAERGTEAILEAAGKEARILDVGTGSGRISVPLLEHGADLVGIDISRKMMALLRQKFPAARLAEADGSRLPFPNGHFDAVTTCHVMHLVGPWQEALHEYRRVLRAGGVYIDVETELTSGDSPGRQIKSYWKSRVEAYGASTRRPGADDHRELEAALTAMGATIEKVEVARYSRSSAVQEVVEGIANRIHSSTWVVPDDVFAETVRDLRAWTAQEFRDPGMRFEEEAIFMLAVARFPGAASKTSKAEPEHRE